MKAQITKTRLRTYKRVKYQAKIINDNTIGLPTGGGGAKVGDIVTVVRERDDGTIIIKFSKPIGHDAFEFKTKYYWFFNKDLIERID